MREISTGFVFSVIGAITGIIGLIISLIGMQKSRYDVVSEFLSQIEDSEFIKIRKYVYNEALEENDPKAASIVNFFHHWGLMVKKHYLPIWVFDGATGNGMLRLFEKVKPYIENNRKRNNDKEYAQYFEWLCGKVEKRKKRNKNNDER